MSMNSFMHPRNIYRTPPDFTQLAVDYPDIRNVGSLDMNGKVRLDFKNERTLRTLTRCLLQKDFGLNVTLPDNKLVPTLSLRLNYILWLEDIMNMFGTNKQIIGVDIGCGASCVYPLLAAKCNDWRMYGIESNQESFQIAQKNVKQNQLESQITILAQHPDANLFGLLRKEITTETEFTLDFCMCNPPFFSSEDELEPVNTSLKKQRNRSGKRPAPKNVQTGCTEELVVSGGETEFVRRIITESCELQNRIRVYTTMLGRKESVSIVMKMLRELKIVNVCKTEFCQGHTTRWGIAWSFLESTKLSSVPSYGPSASGGKSKSKSYSFAITNLMKDPSDMREKLSTILKSIELTIEDFRMIQKDMWSGRLTCFQNTWSKQRRKRRVLEREQTQNLEPISINLENGSSDESLYENNEQLKKKRRLTDELRGPDHQPILVVNIKTLHKPRENRTLIDLEYENGSAGRDGTYQLMQFIQNQLNNYDNKPQL